MSKCLGLLCLGFAVPWLRGPVFWLSEVLVVRTGALGGLTTDKSGGSDRFETTNHEGSEWFETAMGWGMAPKAPMGCRSQLPGTVGAAGPTGTGWGAGVISQTNGGGGKPFETNRKSWVRGTGGVLSAGVISRMFTDLRERAATRNSIIHP